MQNVLTPEQVAAFYHTNFVVHQAEHFSALLQDRKSFENTVVLDVGGGQGFFAEEIQKRLGVRCRVADTDPVSVKAAEVRGLEAYCDDALNPKSVGDEGVVCFNLILHHLVGSNERTTRDLQVQALKAWRDSGALVFVNEYIYESHIANLSGRLIFEITRSSFLSAIGRLVANFVPSLKANTFGVGVRFRSNAEWRALFKQAGYRVLSEKQGNAEDVSPARRVLMIKTIRRDSFLLQADK